MLQNLEGLEEEEDKRQNMPYTRVTIRHANDGEEFNLEDLSELYRKTEEEEWARGEATQHEIKLALVFSQPPMFVVAFGS
jgi:hypothetical protein